MLEHFQSFEAVRRQIRNEGYRYFLVGQEPDFCGYFSVCCLSDN